MTSSVRQFILLREIIGEMMTSIELFFYVAFIGCLISNGLVCILVCISLLVTMQWFYIVSYAVVTVGFKHP